MAKESKYVIGNSPIFRETFNDQQTVEGNGGVVTDVSFSEGVGVFDGTADVTYNDFFLNHLDTFSIRARFKVNNHIDYAGIFSSFGTYLNGISLTENSGQIQVRVNSNRVLGTYIIGEWVEVVEVYDINTLYIYINSGTPITSSFSGSMLVDDLWRAGYDDAVITRKLDGEIDLVELYDYALTAEDVSNLYSNSRYLETNVVPILNVTAENGLIEDRAGNSFVNTDVGVVRDGQIWVQDFNGSTSTSNHTITESFDVGLPNTVSLWVKINKRTGNEQDFYSSGTNNWMFTRWDQGATQKVSSGRYDGTNNVVNNNGDAINLVGGWHNIIETFDGLSDDKIYIDGVFYSQDIDVDVIGTRIIPTIYFGQRGSNTYLDGKMGTVIIEQRVWTAEDISQYYSSTKFKYLR